MTYRLCTQFFSLLTLLCHLPIHLWCCILHLKRCILQQKVYELESSAHFQPSCTHSFLLLAYSTILSFVCRLSVTLCTVVKATCCKTLILSLRYDVMDSGQEASAIEYWRRTGMIMVPSSTSMRSRRHWHMINTRLVCMCVCVLCRATCHKLDVHYKCTIINLQWSLLC